MIEGAIFDVDGTLLDSMPIWEVAPIIYLKKLGITPQENLAEDVFTLSQAEWSHFIAEHYDVHQTDEEIQAGICEITNAFYLNEAPLKPGVKEFLEELSKRGIPMIAATNTPRDLIDQVLKRHEIRHHFIDILNCSDLGTNKREPRIYELACEKLGTNKETTWIFEDVLHAAETAKKAGFPLVAVADKASIRQRDEIRELADFFVEDLTGISVEDL
ncbi:MAG: HAD family phosphatase [Eubacterium sp.]|nr:HAD family phosphatase [Eubacterium sp.]